MESEKIILPYGRETVAVEIEEAFDVEIPDREAMEANRKKQDEAIKKILTEDQYKTYTEQMQRRGGPGGPGRGPGGPGRGPGGPGGPRGNV